MKLRFTEFFPFGCQYHRAPTPLPEEWPGDLAEIARQGYTHVQFRPQWRCHERIRGQYEWGDLDRLFELAAQNGLRVILKAQLENAPDWVFTELEGGRVGFHGKPLDPIAHAAFYVGGWWPCFDNPAVAAAAADFTRELASRYKSHPALWFYNAWNEPRSRPLGQCQCRHSLESYRNYLRERFGTIEALNAAYGKAWSSFETVFVPHSHSDYIELFLWRQWAAWAVSRQVEVSAEAFRAADPGHPVMCHVGCSSLVQDPACDTSDDFANAEKVDWYGCSFPIELLANNIMERNLPLYQSAWLRRVDGNYWCQEFYTNYANWMREADPDFLEQAIWMAVASGCRGLTFWQYRSERFGEESNGWGMREIDGSSTRRSDRCDRVAKVLRKLGGEFAETEPVRSPVALWFQRRNDLLMRIEAMQSDLERIDEIRPTTSYPAKRALIGSHTLLRLLGYTADFAVAGDELDGVSLLVVNSMELVDGEAARWLRNFVEQGGTLLVEYPFACRDERTWVTPVRPGHDLEQLLGCREGRRLTLGNQQEEIRFPDGERMPVGGDRVVLLPTSGEVIGRWADGGAAVVRHSLGRGTVLTCGGNAALAFFDTADPAALPAIYRRALAAAGLQVTTGQPWCFTRESAQWSYRFCFGVGENTADLELAEADELCYCSEQVRQIGRRLVLPDCSCSVIRHRVFEK